MQDRISRAAAAAEQLCAVLWETLHAEAAAGRASSVAALSERLTEVTRSVGVLARTGGDAPAPGEGGRAGGRTEAPSARAGIGRGGGAVERGRPEASIPDAGAGAAERGWPEASFPDAGAGAAERGWPEASIPDAGAGAAERGWPEASIPDAGAGAAERGWPEASIPDAGAGPAGREHASLIDEQRGTLPPGAIEVRDVRRSEGSAWRAAVQRRLERFADEGTPFSVLIVEVLDAVRLQLAQPPEEAERLTFQIESAIAGVLRPADGLIREAAGRYWLIAPDTGAALARSLAEQLAAAAGGSASHRGAAIRVTVGIAVCPEHGRDPDTLIGHADMDLYAAQAAGRSVGGFDGGSRLH